MSLRINRDRSHEHSSKLCEVCKLWQIERPAKWIGAYLDGQRILICDACKSNGFKVLGEYFEVNGVGRYNYNRSTKVGTQYEIYGMDKSIHTVPSRADALQCIRAMIANGVGIEMMYKRRSDNNRLRKLSKSEQAKTVMVAME